MSGMKIFGTQKRPYTVRLLHFTKESCHQGGRVNGLLPAQACYFSLRPTGKISALGLLRAYALVSFCRSSGAVSNTIMAVGNGGVKSNNISYCRRSSAKRIGGRRIGGTVMTFATPWQTHVASPASSAS